MALRMCHPLRHHQFLSPLSYNKSIPRPSKLYVHSPTLDLNETHKKQTASENEKLCVFLVEKALSRISAGKEEILGIFDLRGFGPENADLKFLTFLFDVFYNYYPRRLGQVLFVESPFVFNPIWQRKHDKLPPATQHLINASMGFDPDGYQPQEEALTAELSSGGADRLC